MNNKIWMPLIFVLGLLAGGACFTLGFNLLYDGKPPVEAEAAPEQTEAQEPEPMPEQTAETTPVTTAQKIMPYTKMVYQYFYESDGSIVEQEEAPSYFLLDLTREELVEYYSNWQVVSFSDREVIMRRTIADESQERYIVGAYEGRIAVFYEEEREGNSLYMLTDTPIDALSHEEQVRLNDGIFVQGETALAKTLEDYGS